jgi:1-aminocyclopropane-1-carboxylate deaminase/D-cysteine desulfhydrase-like pyridoxal-dependent ACC family enzyme
MHGTHALHRHFPSLAGDGMFFPLGEFPTPLTRLETLERAMGSGPLYVKREDLTAEGFGGNKVRTLEGLFAHAREVGAKRIWTTGAYGSNHAVCMAAHARKAGLESGALLFPQPVTRTAQNNLRALVAFGCEIRHVTHAVTLPASMLAIELENRRKRAGHYVMVPGGAVPRGAFGHVSAALELAEQLAEGSLEPPRRAVLAIGSTCTTAGLLVGFALAARLGLGFSAPPVVHAVRVTPWPVTGRMNILRLAVATSRELTAMMGEVASFTWSELGRSLEIDGRFFGGGYGVPIRGGAEAARTFESVGAPWVDEVYAEKSAACFLSLVRERREGPLLYWTTRATQALPAPREPELEALPKPMRRYLEAAL